MSLKTTRRVDEVLEAIWATGETSEATVALVREAAVGGATDEVLSTMQSRGLISVSGTGDSALIALSEDGRSIARRIIRGHRLAERLVTDVLGASIEAAEGAACEFEHTVSPELTDSICTLLGHPTVSPRGRPIPDGECCRSARSSVGPVVVPATALEIGEEGRVAYVAHVTHAIGHQLASLGVSPGVPVRLHQRYPSYVLKCEETEVAIEESIAKSIFVRRA